MKKQLYSLFVGLLSFAGVANAQTYCTPSSSSASCSSGSGYMGTLSTLLLSGSSGVIDDTLGCVSSGYVNRTSMSCNLSAGSTYGIFITYIPSYFKNIQVWIDFDHDGTFSSTETVGGGNYIGMRDSSDTIAIVIPSGAASGTHRMRILSDYASSSSYPSLNPCRSSSSVYGEVRDYSVVVAASSPCSGTPTGGTASVADYTYCGATYIAASLSGHTSSAGITLQWQSSPDGTTWSDIAGATTASYGYSVTPLTSSIYFRNKVTCSSSVAYSTPDAIMLNRIAGHISFSASRPDTLTCKVWLIEHDSARGTLTAVDSVITCNDSSAMDYYEFNGMAASSHYLVKAKSLDATSTMVGASGYVPTYGYSNTHWDSGTVINHVSDYDSLHILMIYGTVPAGPGFVGGSIVSGAGKGTAGEVPVSGMLVLLENAATHVLTQAYTDASGRYAFAGIALGTYIIHPEYLGYTTTPFTLTLTTATDSLGAVNFKQGTTSKTIYPFTTSIVTREVNGGFTMSPNPATHNINLSWNNLNAGTAQIIITDVTGREVKNATINIAAAFGNTAINVSDLNNGIYFIKIRNGNAIYTEKMVVKH